MSFTRHSISLPNLHDEGRHEIVFYDWGNTDSKNVAFCVHGLTRNARDFDFLAPALVSRGYRVMALSMAGRGESALLENPMAYNYATYVADCIAVMSNFHMRSVDWVGTSMGGIIGMMVAAFHPDRVRKLVLNDVGSFLSKEALGRIYKYVSEMPVHFADRAAGEAYIRTNFAPWGITEEAHWQHLINHSISQNADGTWRYLCDPRIAEPLRVASGNFTKVEDVNLAEVWDKVNVPTYIIRGATSDILQEDTVSAMRRIHLRADTVTIPNVGHAPALMNHEQISLITDWLTRDALSIAAAGM
ncbi:MAG: alpha/beta hydrolase [Alphaproteobacteria bacterium]|nr:alpha/beta hydrolase [Alphaproteobacteria bacterium]